MLHPLIRADMDRRAAIAAGPYLVMAIPLLVESGARDRVDRILVVDVAENVQLERVLARGTAAIWSRSTRFCRLRPAGTVAWKLPMTC